MIDENEIKKGIALMYYQMGKQCIKTSEAIEEDLEKYNVTERKVGTEMEIADGRKYQLILELKELEKE